jgi:ABC-type phosphate transport system auxiliary subunit
MSDVKNIADILPEDLSESTLNAIAKLVDTTINEQVQEQISLLESKVSAYLRTKIDSLKEQALTELSEENEVFRNARLFESVKTLMSIELTGADEDNAVAEVTAQNSELQEEFDVLVEQANSLVLENEQLQNTLRVLNGKVSQVEESVQTLTETNSLLQEEVANLEASQEEAFVSSEKAVVISHADEPINEENSYQNEFLNDEVMKFMPFSEN